MKKIKFLLVVMLSLFLVGCGKTDTTEGTLDDISFKETNKTTNYVKIDTSRGLILVELYPDIAPLTVENFQKLVSENYYKNSTFHRVVKDFMIQGGINESKEADTIKGEFESNGVENNLKHDRGVISMARANDKDSASSQFFIMHKDSPHLDGEYAAFGKTIAGMDTVDKIANTNVNGETPVAKQTIYSITFVDIKK